MKKLSISVFALALLFTVGSAFTSPWFSGYRLFILDNTETQPTTTPVDQRTNVWFDANLSADDQQATEYDLASIVDPSPVPGDELCSVSSEICVAQIKILNDAVDTNYPLEFEVGSLIE